MLAGGRFFFLRLLLVAPHTAHFSFFVSLDKLKIFRLFEFGQWLPSGRRRRKKKMR